MDPHFFADPDPDPESQNNADPADPDPDPKHWTLKPDILPESLYCNCYDFFIGSGQRN